MIRKIYYIIPFVFVCCLLLSGKVFAANSDIEILVTSPVNSLQTESGIVAVEQFPAQVRLSTTARTGVLTDIRVEFGDQSRKITPEYILTIENKNACGPYTITASTDQGAVLTIVVNVVFQVKATHSIRYRTLAMNIKEIYEDKKLLKSFSTPQRIDLVDANTVAVYEQERIAGWTNGYDGGTYILKGSLVIEVHNASTKEIYGTYDTHTDFSSLAKGYGWTEKAITAFETMGDTALSYQAPVGIDINAVWCDESKQEVYGRKTAQDMGVPKLIYPYQTTSVTFAKNDIPLSRNFTYCGLEWDYMPESAEYADGDSKTQTAFTQKINFHIPATQIYFKFRVSDGNDLSVSIQAPSTVKRGDNYSFSIIYMNNGKNPAYDVPLIGTVDGALIKEIPAVQDFQANTSKTYTIRRTADTSASEIRLWGSIGVPDGFVDGNRSNNTATAVIKVTDPEPEATPGPGDDPSRPDNPDNPDGHDNPEDGPPDLPEFCDLSTSILAPPTIYVGEPYSFTVNFTNHSDVELQQVSLLGKNNEDILTQIPQTVSFKPQETKAYTVTGTAGNAGEIYRLLSIVQAPEDFADKNTINNTAVSSIRVVERPSDGPDNPPDDPDAPNNPGNPTDPDNPDNPGNPNNPNEPGNPPDIPIKLLCDVWVNMSSPPTVIEQSEYNFTVYFANSSDKELSGVSLQVTINGNAASGVPATANFKPYEKKYFVVTSTAGVKGEPLKLVAQVSPPAGYEDIYPGNNQASSEIMVLARPYDLDVQRITPDRYKENQTVVTTIKVSNTGSQDFTPGQNVTVLFKIPELSISKRMDAIVMQRDTWNVVSVRWDTPGVQSDKNITLIATINPSGTLNNETTTDNNTYTQGAVIQNVDYTEPIESQNIPAPPQRNEQPRTTWWEQRFEGGQFVWREFYAELKVSAVLDYATKSQNYLKSGYGYSVRVSATISTNYDRPEFITAPQTAELYLPEYRYVTAIPLVRDGGQYVLKENPASPFRYRVQYIPLWFPDNKDYIAQLLVTDVHTPGGTLSRWVTGGELRINVVDSMYSDDVTTGN